MRSNSILRAREAGVLICVLAVALAVFAVSPAFAENQRVQLEDNAFLPPAVAVKPGETVTWTYPATTEHHNVHFEDGPEGPFADPDHGPWTYSRTFPTESAAPAYRYYCEEHGNPGRLGMAGVVYVNAEGKVPGVAPVASFTVAPGTARVDEQVVFDAAGTTDPDEGEIVRHEWDPDGDGTYEIDSGTQPSTSRKYATPGTRTVGLRVTDRQGHTHTTTRSVTVTHAPVASFAVSPSPAQPGQTVSFNGSASNDPDGTIAKHQWDLDGNGSYETDTGATATTSRSYSSPGTLTVRLLVTDDLGVTSETTRTLTIAAPPQIPNDQPPSNTPGTQPGPNSSPTGCARLSGARRTACLQKGCRRLTGRKRAACVSKSCRYLKRSQRSACARKSCRYLSGGKKKSCLRKHRRRKP